MRLNLDDYRRLINVIRLLLGLYDLSEAELTTKLDSSKDTISHIIRDMNNSKASWSTIKDELKKLRLFCDLSS